MNLIIFSFMLNSSWIQGRFHVSPVYLLENMFWDEGDKQIETDKGFLHRVDISFENGKNKYMTNYYYLNTCCFVKYKDRRYAILRYAIDECLHSFVNSRENDSCFLKLSFVFTEDHINNKDEFKSYHGRRQVHKTYITILKTADKKLMVVNNNFIQTRVYHIMERFAGIVIKGLQFQDIRREIDEIKSSKNFKDLAKRAMLNVYYFKNSNECLENLENFLKSLRYLKIIDGTDENETNIESHDTSTTLTNSQFYDKLYEKFNAHLNKQNISGPARNRIDITLELLFNECCYHTLNMIKDKNFFCIVNERHDIDYYINGLFDLLLKFVKEIKIRYEKIESAEQEDFLEKMIETLRWRLKGFYETSVNDLCEDDFIPNHLYQLLKREINLLKDYMIAEKIVCDYYNMIFYWLNLEKLIKEPSTVLYGYHYPAFVDKYAYRIIDGICVFFNSENTFLHFQAFNEAGSRVYLEKDVHYYFNEENDTIIFIVEALNEKNVFEIEIISENYTFGLKRERFNVETALKRGDPSFKKFSYFNLII